MGIAPTLALNPSSCSLRICRNARRYALIIGPASRILLAPYFSRRNDFTQFGSWHLVFFLLRIPEDRIMHGIGTHKSYSKYLHQSLTSISKPAPT